MQHHQLVLNMSSSHMNWFNQNHASSVFRTVDVSVLWVLQTV